MDIQIVRHFIHVYLKLTGHVNYKIYYEDLFSPKSASMAFCWRCCHIVSRCIVDNNDRSCGSRIILAWLIR